MYKLKKIITSTVMLSVIVTGILTAAACTGSGNEDKKESFKEASKHIKEDVSIKGGVVYYSGDIDRDASVVQYDKPKKGDVIAKINIKNYGTVSIRLFMNQAPLAVENFIGHAKSGYYDDVTFHRVIDQFMIQGGDPEGTGMGGESIWKYNFEDEFSKYLMPVRGALCMANAGTDTNGSQFFIVQNNSYRPDHVLMLRQKGVDDKLVDYYKEVGGCGWLYGQHTVFGQVFEGMDVVDKIAQTQTDEYDMPIEPVVIDNIEISTYE